MTEEGTTVMEAEDFLELLWGEKEGWVDLPAKVGAYWVPYPIEWPLTDDLIMSRRIDQSLRDEEDLYYSVAQFARRGRNIEDVLPVGWLWADLDEVHPSAATAFGFMPTVAVESSPGRYQALWRLTKDHPPRVIEKLNRGLTYALGADKGGWDLTQVLRIPGTRNFKYPGAPPVKMMWANDLVYKARDVWTAVKAHVPQGELAGVTGAALPRLPISRKAKQLLWTKPDEVVLGERSARLWELNCLLAEAGLTEDEVFRLVVGTVWNKWAGQRGGDDRLRRDVLKAVRHVRQRAKAKAQEAQAVKAEEKAQEDATGLKVVSYSTFMAMAMETPEWLVEDIWTAESHGIIGGEPKTSKTTLALAMGLAVASGRDFLGRFAVHRPGPVLMVQEENDPYLLQDRLRKLAAHAGLIRPEDTRLAQTEVKGEIATVLQVDVPTEYPLAFMNNCGFDLSVEEHQDFLEGYVSEIRPRLVILDPLYLVFGPYNMNQMDQAQPFLKWLIQLRFKYGCAVAIVHHMGKSSESTRGRRPGQRLIGSAILHGFTDSAIYTTELKDERDGWSKVRIDTEFRSQGPQQGFEMAWVFGERQTLDCSLEVGEAKQRVRVESNGRVRVSRIERQIAAIVRQQEGITVPAVSKRSGLTPGQIRRHINTGEQMILHKGGPGKPDRIFLNGNHR